MKTVAQWGLIFVAAFLCGIWGLNWWQIAIVFALTAIESEVYAS